MAIKPTKQQIAQAKARAGGNDPMKFKLSKKQATDLVANAAMMIGPGKFLKAGKVARVLLAGGKDAKVAAAMKNSAKIKKRMDAVDASDKAARLAASKKLKDGLKSGALKMTGPSKKPVVSKPTVSKPKYDPSSSAGFKPAAPAKKAASKPNVRKIAEKRVRDLKAEKYRASLSKEKKPLSKEPKLSNETKKLLEKFQTPAVQPPSTRTGLGGMIGEGRPLARGQRLRAKRAEYEKRDVTVTKKDPKDIAEERKSARPKKVKLPLKRPAKPAVSEKLKPNQKRFTERGKASEQDLEGNMDVQTVRGKKYPDGYPQRPSRDGATIESRTSQHPGSRGREIDKSSAKSPEEILQQQVDNAVNSKWTGEAKYPAAEGTTRRTRVTAEERLVTLKKQVRSKRAAEVARKARVEVAKKKLSPKKRIAIKKDVKAIVERTKK